MDTRNKILEWREAKRLLGQRHAGAVRWKVVTGYFDPLLASHVRRLREIAGPGGRLIVAVADPDRPLLPARARAELVAALEMVEAVVPAEGNLSELHEMAPAIDIYHEESSDERRRDELIRHVHERQDA